MARIESHRDLIVWQKGLDLVELVYEVTEAFPTRERYRLVDQLSRAIVSVPANVAEGHARSTAKDFANFLAIARGSLAEAETYIELAVRLKYITTERAGPVFALIDEVGRMLTTLRRRISPRT
jgi:four helix bundle protein